MKRFLHPIVTGSFLSILFSLLAILQSHTINHDAVLYLRGADAFINQGLQAAYSLYKWPFYSILIGSVSQVFHLSLLHAAYTLNILLQLGMLWVFVGLIKDLGGDERIQWFAVLVLLLYPSLQDYRAYVVRDFGYWFFYLLALRSLLNFCETGAMRSALLWGFAILLAALFRIEGLMFFLLQPWFLLLNSQQRFFTRCKFFLKANTVLAGLAILMSIFLMYTRQSLWGIGRFDHVWNAANSVLLIKENILHIAKVLSANLLNPPGQHDAIPMAISGLAGLYFYKLIKVADPLYFLLAIFASKIRAFKATTSREWQLAGFIVINLLLNAYFIASFNFLSGRYVVALALTILLWVPFGLNELMNRARRSLGAFSEWRIFWYGTILVFSIVTVRIMLHAGHDKVYLRQASRYLEQNIPSSASLYTNSPQLLFYAKGATLQWDEYCDKSLDALRNGKIKPFDFYAIHLVGTDRENENLLKSIPRTELMTFRNHKGDKVVIFG